MTCNLILLGSPGSGKGTIAQYLKEHFHYKHLSTGDLFRKEISKKSPLGTQLAAILDSGKLVDDDTVTQLLQQNIPKIPQKILIDGFPRTLRQAQKLQEFWKVQMVIQINISQETALKRIKGRLRCTQCGLLYNLYFKPPCQEAICDQCQSPLSRRNDDTEKVIRERLHIYQVTNVKLQAFYSQQKLLFEIDGEQTTHAVIDSILAAITPDNQKPSFL